MSALRRNRLRLCTVCDEPGRRWGGVILCARHAEAVVRQACPRCSEGVTSYCKHCDDLGDVPQSCAECGEVVLLTDGCRCVREPEPAVLRELDEFDEFDSSSLERLFGRSLEVRS